MTKQQSEAEEVRQFNEAHKHTLGLSPDEVHTAPTTRAMQNHVKVLCTEHGVTFPWKKVNSQFIYDCDQLGACWSDNRIMKSMLGSGQGLTR